MQGQKLSRRERQIMDILYQRGEGTVSDVMEDLSDPPSYSAVRATLRVLEGKGHVKHREDGPRYVYLPAVARERARRDALQHLLQTFFGGSAEQAVAALMQMSEADLTPGDLERLAERTRQARKEGR